GVYFQNHLAYVSCGFGIVVIDLIRKEIKDTYYIGPLGTALAVNGLANNGTYFYAATDSGIFKANASSTTLFNYQEWSRDTSMSGVANPLLQFSGISYYAGNIFVVFNQQLKLKFDGSTWSDFVPFDHSPESEFSVDNNFMMLKNDFSVAIYDPGLTRTALFHPTSYSNADPKYAVRDNDGTYWIADAYNGLVKFNGSSYEFIVPNSPSGINAWAMEAGPDGIWVAGGSMRTTSCG